jgi:membrane protease YdiL (CAAX protease family)
LRIPKALAWLLILLAMFTAGLLRQFHDLTPTSPFLAPAVGSLLFACILFLFLVAARERQIGSAPGPGLRLGSLTPFLLMLLVEKWISSSFYQPVFAFAAPPSLSSDDADAWWRLLCGVGLLGIVAIVARFSRPASRWIRARLAGPKLVSGLAASTGAILGAGAFLAGVGLLFGSGVKILPPDATGALPVVIAGQLALALAEETYYRGALLGELLRLSPRLGLSSPPMRRWVALGATSFMFGMEHLGASSSLEDGARQMVFALALGTLLGLLVLLTDNLWFAAAMHAWINLLLLGAAPRLAFGPAQAVLPPGASISLALIGAFIAAFALQRRRSSRG